MDFLASADCKYSTKLLQGTPFEALRFTAREFRSAVQSMFGVPQSRCLPIAGRPITNHAKNTPLRVDVYGYFLKTVTGAKYDGTRQLHDFIANLLSGWLKRAHVPHKSGAWGNPLTFKDTFSEQINRLSNNDSDNTRWLKLIIPDIIIKAPNLAHLEEGAHARFGDAITPRGCQDADTRAGLLKVAIYGLRCIRPEVRGEGTRRLQKNCQEARCKTRHARGRNWARRDQGELLEFRTGLRLCRRRVWWGFDAGPRPRRPRRQRSQRRVPRRLRRRYEREQANVMDIGALPRRCRPFSLMESGPLKSKTQQLNASALFPFCSRAAM